MKGLEKLTTIRLAEVLTQRGSIETDAITDALYAQDRHGEVFVDVLVQNGNISEWDLARIVVEHFQLPFAMASSHDVTPEVLSRFPRELLFQHRIVPLGVFEDVATVVLPILVPFDVLSRLQDASSLEIFPYVGLTSENNRVLGELFTDEFQAWIKREADRREELTRKSSSTSSSARAGGSWTDIFDSADASVRDGLKG